MPAPAMASHRADDPAIINRVTQGGRHLWYRLQVIQQPERARACGSGPKSCSDRRPVDPPPVVELRIFEGPNLDSAKDITFHYNANFFLFATLEHSRVIAHGRVQTPAANTPPVLTGMPVAGMAYLDRPKEAGYFLFPDLSVRHEGRYRLSFDLYEQAKEDRDMDQIVKQEGDSPLNPEQIPEYFAWRMNIKCKEFVVFSAKKFPGLTESTALSRTVAEQGCRVRIRRDVRMRRRDGKGGSGNGGGNGEFENEEEFSRRRRTATPEAHKEFRQRSMSQESSHRTPYSAEAQRRQSGADYPPPPPPPSFGGPHSAGAGGHLTFGAAAGPHYHQHGSVPPSPSYPGGAPPAYAHQPSYAPPPPPQQVAHMEERPASQHYPPPSPMSARHSVAGDSSRRPSTGYGPPPPPPSQGEPERVHGAYQYPPPPTPPASRANPPTLPPLSTLIPVGGSRPMAGAHIMNPAPLEAEPEPLTSRSSFSIGDMVYSAASSHPGKRSFAESDPRADYDRAYKNHSRESERMLLPDPNPSGSRDMPYRRADGRRGYGHYHETQ